MNDEPENERLRWGQVLATSVVTMLAIPFLFLVTCVPIGAIQQNWFRGVPFGGLFAAVVLIVAFVVGWRSESREMRLGIVAGLAGSAVIVAFALFG
jgi:hypothetical protein